MGLDADDLLVRCVGVGWGGLQQACWVLGLMGLWLRFGVWGLGLLLSLRLGLGLCRLLLPGCVLVCRSCRSGRAEQALEACEHLAAVSASEQVLDFS